jgi:hypothetical protein
MLSPVVARYAPLPAHEWFLYGDGHVLAAAIVGGPTIEAQILLDGQVLYRSRHSSLSAAAEELFELRWQWARGGWTELA